MYRYFHNLFLRAISAAWIPYPPRMSQRVLEFVERNWRGEGS
jgi:hypothetical protein